MKKWTLMIIIFCFLTFVELFALILFDLPTGTIIENIIQCLLVNIAIVAFFTWHEDNKISYTELVFEFDKKWDEVIDEISDEIYAIRDKSGEKKANMEDDEYLDKLVLLIRNQKKLKSLLEKMNYYENNNFKMKSYINAYTAIDSIKEAIDLVMDINKFSKKILQNRVDLFNLYKENLECIKNNVDRINGYKDSDEIKKCINNLVKDIDKDIDKYKESIENLKEDDIKDKRNVIIGKAIGNNRYFQSLDDGSILFTSRNWNQKDDNKYETWYTIPKKGDKSIDDGKNYYFIVREANESDEFPYLYISNKNLRELVNRKAINNTDDNYIHFYFKWDKRNLKATVIDERESGGISLNSGTYVLGLAKLRDKNLYK